jgi:DNA transposition AAA+ family ATPase
MHNASLPPTDRDEPAAQALAAPASNAAIAMTEARQRIPGDVVNKATADLPDSQRSSIRRFHAFYIENDLSLEEAARLIRLSGTTLSLVLRGKYDATLDNVVSEIESFFELQDKRRQGRKMEFIQTKLTERIWNVCDAALEFQRIAFIFSESQVGKTEALQAYARAHNHGSTIYTSVPTGGHLLHFLCKLAGALRISHQQRRDDLRRRIIEAFDDRMLLIVDEAHQCVPVRGRSPAPLQTIEFVRELFDESKCGLVICATNVFRDAMERDAAFAGILKQTRRRRLCAVQLPDRPSREDLNTFSAAYGLPPSSGQARALETALIGEEALGMWLTLLRMAAKLATQAKQPLSWPHVLTAHAGLQALEGTSR